MRLISQCKQKTALIPCTARFGAFCSFSTPFRLCPMTHLWIHGLLTITASPHTTATHLLLNLMQTCSREVWDLLWDAGVPPSLGIRSLSNMYEFYTPCLEVIPESLHQDCHVNSNREETTVFGSSFHLGSSESYPGSCLPPICSSAACRRLRAFCDSATDFRGLFAPPGCPASLSSRPCH